MRKLVAYTLVSVDGVAESPDQFLFHFDKTMPPPKSGRKVTPRLRDQALALSGLWVDKIGGPPVRPCAALSAAGALGGFQHNQIRYRERGATRVLALRTQSLAILGSVVATGRTTKSFYWPIQ